MENTSKNNYAKTCVLNVTADVKDGQNYVSDVYFTSPFKIMKPFHLNKNYMTVMMQTASAGILKGDYMRKKRKKQMEDIDLMEELEYYQPRKKRLEIPQKYVIAAVLILLAGAAFLFSPFFAVKNIRVENSERFATSDLCERIGLNQGDNAILFNRSKAEDILRQDPYIEDARLVWEFPDTMVISLTERKVRAYVPYMGSYLYIDEEGRVLDVQNVYTEGLPLVKGLVFSGFQRGEVLQVENQESLQVMLQISQMIQKYNLTEFAVEVDVSNTSDIYATVNQVQVHLGTMDNLDQKIRTMAAVVVSIPEEDRGTLDLTDLSKPIVFQYLL